MKKIKWKRLLKAVRNSLMAMLSGLILVCLAALPLTLALKTEQLWWLALYGVVFFVRETWENYNDDDEQIYF